jgi:hypothetical protein
MRNNGIYPDDVDAVEKFNKAGSAAQLKITKVTLVVFATGVEGRNENLPKDDIMIEDDEARISHVLR